MRPLARRSDVIVQQVGTDVIVYDRLRDLAHSLNPVGAYVYHHADGTRDLDALAHAMSAALGVPDDVALVEEAVSELSDARLLASDAPQPGSAVDRRAVLARLGLAAALPLVATLSVPSPLLAQSGKGKGKGRGKGKP